MPMSLSGSKAITGTAASAGLIKIPVGVLVAQGGQQLLSHQAEPLAPAGHARLSMTESAPAC